jgi:putative transposase
MPAKSLLYSFLALTAHLFLPRYSARLQILLLQIRMLKRRLKNARIVATPEEKAELLRLGALLDHDLNGVLQIVQPETYREWRRQSAAGVSAKLLGRKGF